MRAFVVAVVFGVMGVSLGVLPVSAATQTTLKLPLDGTQWAITVTPDALSVSGGEKPFEDTLSFSAGVLTSATATKNGFSGFTYTSSLGFSFKAKQTSKDQGKMAWSGEVSGASIKGTMTWTKKNGSFFSYRFEGKKP